MANEYQVLAEHVMPVDKQLALDFMGYKSWDDVPIISENDRYDIIKLTNLLANHRVNSIREELSNAQG